MFWGRIGEENPDLAIQGGKIKCYHCLIIHKPSKCEFI